MCWSNKLVGHLWKFFSAFNGKVFNRISWAGDHGHRRYLFGEGRWNYTLFERKLFLPEHCWKMMENGWTWFSLSSFLVGRTQQQTETFAEFLLISDWRIRHSQIIPKVRPDLEWIFCLPPFVLAHSSSKVTAGRVVGYKICLELQGWFLCMIIIDQILVQDVNISASSSSGVLFWRTLNIMHAN